MLTAAPPRPARGARRLEVSTARLRQLGTTAPDAYTAGLLLTARHSKRLLLLRSILDTLPRGGESHDHWALLEEAHRRRDAARGASARRNALRRFKKRELLRIAARDLLMLLIARITPHRVRRGIYRVQIEWSAIGEVLNMPA